MRIGRSRRLEEATADVLRQRAWLAKHGGSEAGYVAFYGDSDASDQIPLEEGGRFGAGGQRIYEADLAELGRREAELERLTRERIRQLGRRAALAAS